MSEPKDYVTDIGFSPSVRAEQEARGSRAHYQGVEETMGWRREITSDLASFIANADSFYMASANAAGQPYIQHRGGPKGFLRVLGPTELGFADYAGNRQYITLGNLKDNPSVFLFLMDYPNRRRVKIRGRARAEERNNELIRSLKPDGYRAAVERAILIEVEAWDTNCPQHILPRYAPDVLEPAFGRLETRIKALEAQVRELGGDPGPFEHVNL
ncbi:pyridoxamine 5'-phosphate oxidase family protein [Tepidicaulis sp. LMO-SS28]|uniref:pyridoxamine 5'-phosphate oxidase family protein n=1 Tax=Tepidicaulis sp. LMO-SS28 TaxID=3447455 RepID=UPI003EE27B9E